MEDAVEVGCQDSSPGIRRHGGEERVFVAAGIIDQHIQPAVARQDLGNRLLPRLRTGHIQRQDKAPVRVFPGKLISAFAPGADSQPNEIGRRLLKEGPGDGLPQAAVGACNQNDTRSSRPDAGPLHRPPTNGKCPDRRARSVPR